ncbi:hypothetical protein SNE40_005390 [Patella caerulea]|uniref:Uncharacterized protein n=1 Tax=Patella caerulea TaxID=87958 RepID=A0AAN8PXD6_PATCE
MYWPEPSETDAMVAEHRSREDRYTQSARDRWSSDLFAGNTECTDTEMYSHASENYFNGEEYDVTATIFTQIFDVMNVFVTDVKQCAAIDDRVNTG